MFDEILKLIKEHLRNQPEVSTAIPPGKEDAVHNKIVTHIINSLKNPGTAVEATSAVGAFCPI